MPLFLALLSGCSGNRDAAIPVGADITAPTVSATTPSLAATVATNANIKVLFSEAMDGATITATSFTLFQGSTPVPGTVTYERNVAILNPTAILDVDTQFTATINTGAKDVAGNALAASRTWSFTTSLAVAAKQPVHPVKNAVKALS